MVLLVVFGLLFAPFPESGLWWREVFNSGHIVLFAVLSFFIYHQVKATIHFSNSLAIYFLVLIIGILFAGLTELLQSFVQRDASLKDIYSDFFGLMASLCLIAVYNLKNVQYKKLLAAFLVTVSGGFLLLGMSPLILLSWHYMERQNAFPVIVDFGADWSSSFVRFNNASMFRLSGSGQRKALYPVCFEPGLYPGVSVSAPEPNWSNYQSLRMAIFSKNENNMVLTLRIHDAKHNQSFSDRFNMKLLIRPGLNDIVVPLAQVARGPVNRRLDLKNIAGIGLFVSRLDEFVMLEVSNIFLE